ncbi:S-layer homology domain-containing protein [Paenibacillus pinihumi]|uniref:S-layer homology domain-containing protein n=1 Tax=Paenibacillus pinihumi TaxID=669462 RepID=UPI000421D253|nr:S-layer homology domain-containing protein [Paenibacillus pinihumi]
MKRKMVTLLLLTLVGLIGITQSAWAFSDTKGSTYRSEIDGLKKLGIISGDKQNKFKPGENLTNAEAVVLIVKGLKLNIDNLRFIKEPLVKDYFTKAKDKMWYSQSFIIAQYNGLELPKNIDPSAKITREQFAHYLFKGIEHQGEYMFPAIYISIHDEKDIAKAYKDSVQKMLITKIAALDKKDNFYPKANIKRGEAAAWLYRSIQFAASTPTMPEKPETPANNLKLRHEVNAVNKEVNEVKITGTVGHPGYGLRVSNIHFEGKQAIIEVELVQPDPDRIYPQVVTDVTTSTYVSSGYSIKLVEKS